MSKQDVDRLVKKDLHKPKYSTYINDQAIVASLRLNVAGTDYKDWPVTPENWNAAVDDWPTTEGWHHDEVLFIRTHQAFEVWFALIIHELSTVIREFKNTWKEHAGLELPFVDLHQRSITMRNPEFRKNVRLVSSGHFEKTKAFVAEKVSQHPDAASALEKIIVPGCISLGTEMNAPDNTVVGFIDGYGNSTEFGDELVKHTRRIQRASKALLCSVPFFDVLATMTPQEFLKFRDRLQPASGFGSAQFREIELLMGLKELSASKLKPAEGIPSGIDGLLAPTNDTPSTEADRSFYQAQTQWGHVRVARRAREHSLRDVVYSLLNAYHKAANEGEPNTPEDSKYLSAEGLDRFLLRAVKNCWNDQFRSVSKIQLDDAARETLQAAIIQLGDSLAQTETLTAAAMEMMPNKKLVSLFFDACLELDSALLQWRDRHIRFVWSMIGNRRGTGGGGVKYLLETVGKQKQSGDQSTGPDVSLDEAPLYRTHAFPCLWRARTFI